MLPVYIIQMASVNCSDGDVLMEALLTKLRIEIITKHGYFQAVYGENNSLCQKQDVDQLYQ